jgi:hypothetical protein
MREYSNRVVGVKAVMFRLSDGSSGRFFIVTFKEGFRIFVVLLLLLRTFSNVELHDKAEPIFTVQMEETSQFKCKNESSWNDNEHYDSTVSISDIVALQQTINRSQPFR